MSTDCFIYSLCMIKYEYQRIIYLREKKIFMKLSHLCDLIERNIEHVNVWMIGMICRKEVFIYHHEI